MTWVLLVAIGLGWGVAAGLYLQLKDALELARSWKETALLEGRRAQANLNLAEFAVRQLDPSEPLPSLEELRHLKAVD